MVFASLNGPRKTGRSPAAAWGQKVTFDRSRLRRVAGRKKPEVQRTNLGFRKRDVARSRNPHRMSTRRSPATVPCNKRMQRHHREGRHVRSGRLELAWLARKFNPIRSVAPARAATPEPTATFFKLCGLRRKRMLSKNCAAGHLEDTHGIFPDAQAPRSDANANHA
jgi:hypothetical protein